MQEQTGGQGWAFQSLLMFNLRGRDRQISPELGVSSPTSPGKETPGWRLLKNKSVPSSQNISLDHSDMQMGNDQQMGRDGLFEHDQGFKWVAKIPDGCHQLPHQLQFFQLVVEIQIRICTIPATSHWMWPQFGMTPTSDTMDGNSPVL